ncbi:hypothetical protein C3492_14435 [Streptomyces sp. Ru62]|uniref:hypothetical protein n=1 Tax=Streptomyces sp. Ru62 TaxID=2080745 RepID=UPI000CDDFE4A|nr:hypothetical protein [Streptomyces sp. Ru62]POX62867.1 hypothetical protein C3492_14435 [Streptomyces sp. Ru62]
MLLDRDHPSIPGADCAGLTAGDGAPVADTALREADQPARGPHTYLSTVLTEPVKWLIGVPFRIGGTRVIRMYYVVDEDLDVADAVHVAMERANDPQERHAHGDLPVEAERIEVRRILLDILGRISLDDGR